MKNLIRILLCLSLVGFANSATVSRAASPSAPSAAKATTKKTTGKKANAAQLLAAAQKAQAAMLKNARADKGLDPSLPKNKPFYAAAEKVSTQLGRAEKGLAAKNDDFFGGISQARSAQEQLMVAWGATGSKNKRVMADGKALGNALDTLRMDYSKEAARKKKGGELTAKEKADFAKIKANQMELLTKIDQLQAKAKNDPALQRGLAKMKNEAQRIANAPLTVNDYVNALYLINDLEGQLYGYDYYIQPAWRSDWIVVDAFVGLFAPFYYDFWTGYPYDWAWVNTPVDIYYGNDVYVTDADLAAAEAAADAADDAANAAEDAADDAANAAEDAADAADAADDAANAADDTADDAANASDDAADDGANDAADAADDGGGDDGGADDGAADDGGGDDGGGDDGGGDDGGGDDGE